AYTAWLAESHPPVLEGLTDRETRLLQMLHFDLWSSDRTSTSLKESMDRLWMNPNMVNELKELLGVLGNKATRLTPNSKLEREIPLAIHSRYSRNEILAAFGEATSERPVEWREGVKWIKPYKIDAFLVTLNKSEKL